MENKFYLGIDVSKKKLDCSIFVDNININQFPHFTVTNDKEGYKNMLDTLKAMGYNPKETLFGLEFCGCYSDDLEQFFTKKKLSYTMLPTNVLKNYPRGTRDKNDKLDSAKLADYICRYDGTEAYKLRKLPPENLKTQEAEELAKVSCTSAYRLVEPSAGMQQQRGRTHL